MTSTLVIYVRHGRTPTTGVRLPGRSPGLHLSNEGINQAKKVASQLKEAETNFIGKKVNAIYSSPMERARETAAPIAEIFGLQTKVINDLNECEFGTWTGRKLNDLRKLKAWGKVKNQPSAFRFPEGESFSEMQTRITGQITELVSHHSNQTIVCVSHADPIKAALAYALGTPLDLFQRIFFYFHKKYGP